MNAHGLKLNEAKSEAAFLPRASRDAGTSPPLLRLFVLLGIACCALTVPPSTHASGGIIVCNASGVPGAEVRVINEKSREIIYALGNSAESFAVDDLVTGTYTVEVTYPGLPKWAQTGIQVTPNSVTNLSARFSGNQYCSFGWQAHPVPWWARSSGQLLRGTVTRTDQLAQQMKLRVTNERSKTAVMAQVNDEGQFAIGGLPAGIYTVEIIPFMHSATRLGHIRVSENSITSVEASLGDVAGHAKPKVSVYSRLRTPPVRITGRVMDSSGAIVPNAEVRVTKEEFASAVIGLGTCDGVFAFYGLTPGTYKAEVRSPGFRTWVQDHLSLGGDVINLHVVLEVGSYSGPEVTAAPVSAPSPPALGQVKGKIADRMGYEVAGATIRIRNDVTGISMMGQSNMDGRFAFNSITPGTYKVEINFPGLEDCILKDIGAISGKASNIDVVMGKGTPSVGDVHTGPIQW